jgi:uncharacterized protein (DUF1697 family)
LANRENRLAKKSATRRYIAFLRGINVGGHRVKMDHLADLFAALKFTNVSTFIASGNVIFESPSKDTALIENKIEKHLEQALGFPADTFVRTPAELATAIATCPFALNEENVDVHAVHIGFLRGSLDKEIGRKLESLGGPMDEFKVVGREFFWLCRGRTTDSLVSWPVVAKTVAMSSTMRNLKMLRRLAALHPAQ